MMDPWGEGFSSPLGDSIFSGYLPKLKCVPGISYIIKYVPGIAYIIKYVPGISYIKAQYANQWNGKTTSW